MKKYNVIIIGGGVSGLSCAITLGSAEDKLDVVASKNILVIDAGASHLNKAELNNAAGVDVGSQGPEVLESLKKRAMAYKIISLKTATVTEVSGKVGNFQVKTESTDYQAEVLVFANGMQTIEVDGIGADVVENKRAPRPGMVMIQNENGVISEGKYVTGCAAGASSMFTTAAGYGAQTATDIISSWTGKYTVIHDVYKKK